MSDPKSQRRALLIAQERFPETDAAKEAGAAIAKLTALRTAEVIGAPRADARAALTRALEVLQDRYPNTDAARQARDALVKPGAQAENKADATCRNVTRLRTVWIIRDY